MATSNHTSNYNLSQYAAGDPVKFLTNYNQDMLEIDAAIKAAKDSADGKTPLTRTISGLPLTSNITLAQLVAAGLADQASAALTLVNGWTANTNLHAPVAVRIGKAVLINAELIVPAGSNITFTNTPYPPAAQAHFPANVLHGGTFYTVYIGVSASGEVWISSLDGITPGDYLIVSGVYAL